MKTARFPQRLPHRPHWTHRLGAILRLALGLVLLSTAGWLPVSQAAAGDGRWVDGFTLDGVNDEVKAIVADGPNAVYVGGCFTVAGEPWRMVSRSGTAAPGRRLEAAWG